MGSRKTHSKKTTAGTSVAGAKGEDWTAADEAALDAYENSPEGRAGGQAPPKTKAEQLTALFLKTPEMQECAQTADAINSALNEDDTVPIRIDVPRQLIRLAEFLEEKRARRAGVKPVTVDQTLRDRLLNQLQDDLHSLVVEPGRFDYYRALWNEFCDEHGAPEEKIPGPESDTPI